MRAAEHPNARGGGRSISGPARNLHPARQPTVPFYEKAILATLLLLGAVAVRGQVRFETLSTDALRERAVKSGKLVFIELYADWCPPCRVMEREVFSDREVGAFFERHFVAARYDTDRSTGRALMKRYGSGAIPLGLVFDAEGNLLGRIQGAAAPEVYLNDLREILARRGRDRK